MVYERVLCVIRVIERMMCGIRGLLCVVYERVTQCYPSYAMDIKTGQ